MANTKKTKTKAKEPEKIIGNGGGGASSVSSGSSSNTAKTGTAKKQQPVIMLPTAAETRRTVGMEAPTVLLPTASRTTGKQTLQKSGTGGRTASRMSDFIARQEEQMLNRSQSGAEEQKMSRMSDFIARNQDKFKSRSVEQIESSFGGSGKSMDTVYRKSTGTGENRKLTKTPVTTPGGYYDRPEFNTSRLETYSRQADGWGKQLEQIGGQRTQRQRELEGMAAEIRWLQEQQIPALKGAVEEASSLEQIMAVREQADRAQKRLDELLAAYTAGKDELGAMDQQYNQLLTKFNAAVSGYDSEYAKYKEGEDAWRKTVRTDRDAIQKDLDAATAALQEATRNRTIIENRLNALSMEQVTPETAAERAALEQQLREAQRAERAAQEQVRLLKDELDYSTYFDFESYRERADFAEKSKYRADVEDRAYRIANKDSETMENAKTLSSGNVSGLSDKETVLQQMTDDEVEMYNYLYATDPEKAQEYIDWLTRSLNARNRRAEEEKLTEFAKSSPWARMAMSAASVPARFFGAPISFVGQTIDYLKDGEIDQNAPYNSGAYIPTAIRGAVAKEVEKKWGKPGSYIYQTAMSLADFTFAAAMTGNLFGGMGNATAQAVAKHASLALMASDVAADTVVRMKDRGLSDEQSYSLGLIAGAAEYFSEMVSLETLLDKTSMGENYGGYILKNFIAEGSEEVVSDFINLFAEVMIAQDESEWRQKIEEYRRNGMSRNAAFGEAFVDQVGEMGLSFLGGAISGGIMGGAAVVIDMADTRHYGAVLNQADSEIRADAIKGLQDGQRAPSAMELDGVTRGLIETGLSAQRGTEARDYAEAMLEKAKTGEKITNYEMGRMARLNERAEANGDLQEESEYRARQEQERRRAARLGLNENAAGETAEETNREQADLIPARDEASGVVLPTAETQRTVLPTAEYSNNQAENLNTAQSSNGQVNQEVLQNGTEQRTETQAAAERREEPAAEQDGRIVLPGGERAGDVSDRDGGRVYGTSTRGQTGVLAEGTEGARERSTDAGREAAGRATLAESVRSERVNVREALGVRSAAENATVRIIAQQDMTPELARVYANNYKQTGKKTTFTLDPIRLANGRSVNAVNTKDGMIVQANHGRYSPEQLSDHEMMHDFIREDAGLRPAIRDAILENYVGDEYRAILEEYVRKHRGVYDLSELSEGEAQERLDDLAEEELFCDAYAGMNKFAQHAERYQETVRETYAERGNPLDRRNRQNAAAMERTNGPGNMLPGNERFSTEDETDSNGVVLSREQAEFFRDSKVRDADGRLLEVYHGTPKGGFTRFEVTDDIGYFFTSSAELANTYSGGGEEFAPSRIETWKELERYVREHGDTLTQDENGNWVVETDFWSETYADDELQYAVEDLMNEYDGGERMRYAVYLNITDPLVVEGNGENWDSITNADYQHNVYALWENGRISVSITDKVSRDRVKFFTATDEATIREELEDLYGNEGDAAKYLASQMYTDLMRDKWRGRAYYDQDVAIDEGGYWDPGKTTREWVQEAQDMGCDGVIFRDITDSGRYGRGTESGDVFVAMDSNQIKSVNNRTPTADPDIRFSLADGIEETADLVALHNLNAEKLGKALDIGGFPMPSIAVTKTSIPHTNFGDITLIMDKTTVDPEFDRRNTTYSADAWTPTFPRTEYEIAPKAESRLRSKYYDLYRRLGDDATRALYPYGNYAEDELNRRGGEQGIIDYERDNVDMMKLYLQDTGAEVPEPVYREDVSRLPDATIQVYDYMINAMGAEAFREMVTKDGQNPLEARREWWAAHGDDYEAAYKEYLLELGFSQTEVDNVMEQETLGSMTRVALGIRNYLKNGPERRSTTLDTAATNDAIRNAVDPAGYDAWLHELFDGIEKSSGIYNGKERYTPSGNMRSFAATHLPVTLENIAKAMAAENSGNSKNTSGFYGVKSLRAATAKEFRSIDEMHRLEGRLQHLTEEEAEQITETLSDRMMGVMQRIYDTKPKSRYDNSFIDFDHIGEIMAEAADRRNVTVSSIQKALSGTGYTVDEALAQDIKDLFSDIAQMPVNIFEAKPKRAVRFDEVLAAVVPDDTDPALISRLQEAGVRNVMEYERDNNDDRLEKVNSVPEARFSVEDDQTVAERFMAWSRENPNATSQEAGAELRRIEREQQRESRKAKQQETEKPPKLTKPPQESRPIIAKRELRQSLERIFSIPSGMKKSTGDFIDQYADKLLKKGSMTMEDRETFFNHMYETGVVEETVNDAATYGRSLLKGRKFYVNDTVREELGDDWNEWRKRAMAAGFWLTNDQSDPGLDMANQELSEIMPGLFNPDDTDLTNMLQTFVQVAEEGKAEQMPLAEYVASIAEREYVSEDEVIRDYQQQMERELDKFAEKANLEVYLRDRTGIKIAEERAKYQEALAREREKYRTRRAMEQADRQAAMEQARERRDLREMQQRTLRTLKQLKKMRNKTAPELQPMIDQVLGDLDLYAIGAANELRYSKRYDATWGDIAEMYAAYKQDEDFIPNADLERIMQRVIAPKIGDMTVEDLQDRYNAAVGLLQNIYNRNRLLADEYGALISEVTNNAAEDIRNAPIKGGEETTLGKIFNTMQLTPMNMLERMAGWNPDSDWMQLARKLEDGERKRRKYIADSQGYLADEFVRDNADWVKKADGQGRDAIWYQYDAPEITGWNEGNKPIFSDKKITVWFTPAQKVHMALESKNIDNLRHMMGGRTFPNKELYSKGKTQEAFAQGTTVKLDPATVRAMVSSLTPEEQALYDALEPFYNQMQKVPVNKTSMVLNGYEKATEANYAPIFTNKNYTKSEPGIFDMTAEGIGSLKERVVSFNPSYQISAFDAFDRSVKQAALYIGMAIPVRDMNAVLNKRTTSGESMKDVITHKWSNKQLAEVEDLLTELQGGRQTKIGGIEKLTNPLLNKYISATFGFNPSIVLKQSASFPLAGAYLGIRNMPNLAKALRVSDELINTYTGELAYRTLGYATPETAELKKNPNRLQQSGTVGNFIFGGGAITWMDGVTVKTIWSWAENKVRREQPDLDIGTQEEIDSGSSPFYQAVAREFNEAVSRSQPMYDTMHRAEIMREGGALNRTFTLFKTVPMQEYNMIRQAIGEAQYYKKTGADSKTQRAATRKVGSVYLSIATGNLEIGAITLANALLKNKAKKYRDDDDELTTESVMLQFARQWLQDGAGIMLFGDTAAEIIGNILNGDKWYGLETPGIGQLTSILEQTIKAGRQVKQLIIDGLEMAKDGGDFLEYLKDNYQVYLKAAEDVARTVGTYATGLPIDNLRAYLLGTIKWISPEINVAYEDAVSKAKKAGLSGLTGQALEMRMESVLEQRLGDLGDVDENIVQELSRLYEAGYPNAVPSAEPEKISINGEEHQLTVAQQQQYGRIWSQAIGESLKELVGSVEYQQADEETRAAALKVLYAYGHEQAKEALFPEYKPETSAADRAMAAGATLAEWAMWSKTIADMDTSEKYEALLESGYDDDTKIGLIGGMMQSTEEKTDAGNLSAWGKMQSILDSGLDVDQYIELKNAGAISAYMKNIENGLNAKLAYNAAMAIKGMDPEGDTGKAAKWRLMLETSGDQDEQIQALSTVMYDSEFEKLQLADSFGFAPEVSVILYETLPSYDLDGNGSYKQDEYEAAIDAMSGGDTGGIMLPGGNTVQLTNEERAALWQIWTGSKSAKNNPYDTDVGQAVIDARAG